MSVHIVFLRGQTIHCLRQFIRRDFRQLLAGRVQFGQAFGLEFLVRREEPNSLIRDRRFLAERLDAFLRAVLGAAVNGDHGVFHDQPPRGRDR